MSLSYMVYDTALGQITMVSDGKAIVALRYGAVGLSNGDFHEDGRLYDAIAEINQYCFGQRKQFDLPLDPYGSAFELKVYKKIQEIPYGKTVKLSELTASLGKAATLEKTKEAVLGNPIPILIPCHRVISDEGKSLGYPGGTPLQKKILQMERANMNRTFVAPTDYKDPEDI
ncbi:MAG: methylated-DNA--[protein]-cysteine S-methyltransferase [Erysipelotrichaceae bacterium]|nr:methylated-DNA--[protein]-cysteine S-methyltransferase [Erysipelotrichaceae bacterium]